MFFENTTSLVSNRLACRHGLETSNSHWAIRDAKVRWQGVGHTFGWYGDCGMRSAYKRG